MKKILVIFMLFAAFAAAAQSVELRQTVDGTIDELIINPGWEVHLVQHEADSTFIVISTTADQTQLLQQQPVVTVKRHLMTLLACPTLLRGTRIDIHSSFDFGTLVIHGADVYADSLTLDNGRGNGDIYLLDGAHLYIGTFGCKKKVYAEIDHSVLTADTLQGGTFDVYLSKDAAFRASTYHQQQLIINLPDDSASRSYTFPNATDTACNITVRTRGDGFQGTLNVYLNVGLRSPGSWGGTKDRGGFITYYSGAASTSPYFALYETSFSLPVMLKFDLTPRIAFSAGIGYMATFKWFHNTSVVDADGYLQLADPAASQGTRTVGVTGYLGLPVELKWAPSGFGYSTVKADLFFGHTVGHPYCATLSAQSDGALLSTKQRTQYMNPWKLEVGIGCNLVPAGGVGKVRIFANLLPEFRNNPDLPKVRTCGIELLL